MLTKSMFQVKEKEGFKTMKVSFDKKLFEWPTLTGYVALLEVKWKLKKREEKREKKKRKGKRREEKEKRKPGRSQNFVLERFLKKLFSFFIFLLSCFHFNCF